MTDRKGVNNGSRNSYLHIDLDGTLSAHSFETIARFDNLLDLDISKLNAVTE